MAFWAPEVKRRADAGQQLFAECRDLYEALRADQGSAERAGACLAKIGECQEVLGREPVPARLAHIGRWIP